jgi:hypothetical protein
LDSRSCFASAQAPGGALGALGSLQQWLLCSVPGEQAACSASSLALCAETASSREVSSGGGCFRRSSLHGSSSNLIVLVDMQIPVTPGDSRGSSSGCMFDAQQLFDELPN